MELPRVSPSASKRQRGQRDNEVRETTGSERQRGQGESAPKKGAAGQRVEGEAPAELSRSQVPRMVMVSDQPWPRVMRRLPVKNELGSHLNYLLLSEVVNMFASVRADVRWSFLNCFSPKTSKV